MKANENPARAGTFFSANRLKPAFAELTKEAYVDASRLAAKETGLEIKRFPPEYPYAQQQILDDEFFPGA